MIKDVIFRDSRNYDVIVVGAGYVGLPLSQSLASLGLRVALVEKRRLQEKSADGRIFAFSLDTKHFLEQLYPENLWSWGAFSKIQMGFDQRASSFSFAHESAHHEQSKNMPLGYTISASALWQGMLESRNRQIDLFEDCEVISCSHLAQQAQLSVRHQGQMLALQARLLVAADGAHSQIREFLQPLQHAFVFGQRAFSFKICHPARCSQEERVAYEIFFSQGSAAFLPVSETEAAIIWIESENHRSAQKEDAAAALLLKTKQILKPHIPWIESDEVTMASLPVSHSLVQKKVFQTAFPRTLLIGDAAHTVHPIAGQGLNLALREVKMLVDELHRYQGLGLDWGGSVFLQNIQKKQLFEADRLMGMTFLLVYGLSFEKIPGLWQMICWAMNHLPFMNRWFLQKASRGIGLGPHAK